MFTMEYYVTHFLITTEEELMQISRELLVDSVSEAGYESFEDTEAGVDAYVQTQLYDPVRTKELIDDFPIEGVEITFSSEEALTLIA